MNLYNSTFNGHSGLVPEGKKYIKRYPFVFLLDISASTGAEPDPDIHHINRAIAQLIDMLKNPAPSGQLYTQAKSIDICVLSYNESVQEVVPWSMSENLPASIPLLQPDGGTAMGKALNYAINKLAERLRYYRDPANNISSGLPHIIHLTDGAPTDITPVGSPAWNDIAGKLNRIDGTTDPEKRKTSVLHFCSPKGYIGGGEGAQLLAKLSGSHSVFALGSEIANFADLVKLVTVVITNVTKDFATGDAVNEAFQEMGVHIPTTEQVDTL